MVTNCNQLKLESRDGKKYLTDVADVKTIFRLVQSVPSPKAEPIKLWLAKVGDQSQGYDENAVSAKRGGGIAKGAREQLEQATGEKIVSNENYLAQGEEVKKLKKADKYIKKLNY